MINNLLTLIRSNALGFDNAVLSPKRTVPSPGNETIGLTLAGYSSSLCVFDGLNANLTAPKSEVARPTGTIIKAPPKAPARAQTSGSNVGKSERRKEGY